MVVPQVAKSLPSIKAVIGHIPQHLRTLKIPDERGRLHVLRRIVTNLIREERCELLYNRAVEARPYMERLLQLVIYRGMDDPYVKEMTDWWVAEEDMREKLRDVLIPRFSNIEEPFTNLYALPKESFTSYKRGRHEKYRIAELGLLELKGLLLSKLCHLTIAIMK
uniref:Large ribosomal subunit protein bL17m n=1 Tax=Syphacia muris TaxID=451379 RepID=A0A0N5AI39_9BILA